MDDPIMIDTIRQRIANSEPCFIYENEALMLIARIEQLEAALREVIELSRMRSPHAWSSEADYFRIARAALEGED